MRLSTLAQPDHRPDGSLLHASQRKRQLGTLRWHVLRTLAPRLEE